MISKCHLQRKHFTKVIPIEVNNNYKLNSKKSNSEWNDIFYDKSNNLKNFNYNGSNKLNFKSKKIIKFLNKNSILFGK